MIIANATWESTIADSSRGIAIEIRIDGLPTPEAAKAVLDHLKAAMQTMGQPLKAVQ